MAAAKRALVLEGYSITASDPASGTISTTPRQARLDERACDCGTTMGLPYIRDKRTITTVAMGVVVGDRILAIRADIQGEYLRNVSVKQSIAFNCVSTGVLERELFDRIVEQLPAVP